MFSLSFKVNRGRRGRDRMVVGFMTTCVKQCLSPLNVVSSNLAQARCTRYNSMWFG